MDIAQIYEKFPTSRDCIIHLEHVRWNGTPRCPYCKGSRATKIKDGLRYHCNVCNTSFSVTVGTIFHKTKVDLQRWFLAIFLVLNVRKRISARQLARDVEVNKNTGWFMLTRIRRAMHEYGDMLEGLVGADEARIRGKK